MRPPLRRVHMEQQTSSKTDGGASGRLTGMQASHVGPGTCTLIRTCAARARAPPPPLPPRRRPPLPSLPPPQLPTGQGAAGAAGAARCSRRALAAHASCSRNCGLHVRRVACKQGGWRQSATMAPRTGRSFCGCPRTITSSRGRVGSTAARRLPDGGTQVPTGDAHAGNSQPNPPGDALARITQCARMHARTHAGVHAPVLSSGPHTGSGLAGGASCGRSSTTRNCVQTRAQGRAGFRFQSPPRERTWLGKREYLRPT